MNKNKELKLIKRLETERLIIRPFYPMDLNEFHEYFSIRDVSKDEKSKNLNKSETKRILMHFVNSNNVYAIVLKNNEKVIGSIELFPNDNNDSQISLGYILGKDYWNNGYMTEAIKKIVKYFFTKTNFLSIESTIFIDNIQSKRVMEKCGFRFFKNSELKDPFSNRVQTVNIFILNKPKFYKFSKLFKPKKFPWNK